MKKQHDPAIKAHLIRSASYVLLLLGVCLISFALAQRNTSRRSAPGALAGTYPPVKPAPNIPASGQSQLVAPAAPSQAASPWMVASPYPTTIVRYGFAQTATHFYVFGGVASGTRVNTVNRMDIATGMWQPRAPMPFTSEAPTCALMEATGIVYCTEGDTGTGFAAYNIATDTWTPLASIPGTDHYGSASGAFNGKVFVAGGTTAFSNAVQIYDVATNTWSAGTAAPNDFLLAGYQQVGQYLYVVGGWTGGVPVGLTRTNRLDMSSAPGVWSLGPNFPMGRADFGLAYDAGTNKLYALGGDVQGGGFFESSPEEDELSLANWPAGTWVDEHADLLPPNRQGNQAGFYGAGDIWSVGGINGPTLQFLAEVQRRTNGSTQSCNYTFTTGSDAIVPGDTDVGNHCDDCDTVVALPFAFQLDDQIFNSVKVSSNGRVDLVTTNEPGGGASGCLPAPPNFGPFDYTIFPLWSEYRTDIVGQGCNNFATGCGVFTSVSGSAPNRVFNIEWRVVYDGEPNHTANFEARLYENDPNKRFDIIFGTVQPGSHQPYVSGVQGASGASTLDLCSANPPAVGSRTYGCSSGGCTLCHKRSMTLVLPCNGLEYRRHLDHGDTLGPCPIK